jgi:predicted DNA-binding protein (MmcQ/YjbR family)
MDIEWVRTYCLALPHVTENVQWGDDLCMKVGGKMFAVLNLNETSPNRLTIKSTPEEAAELVEHEGIIPAPYLARHHWVSFQDLEILKRGEMKTLIKKSYDLVVAKLPRKAGLSVRPKPAS